MSRILLLSSVLALALGGCESGNPVSSENLDDPSPLSRGSLADLIATEPASVRTHMIPIDPSEINLSTDAVTYDCLWTSGTYYETGTWNWTDVDFEYTVTPGGTLTIETINYICNAAYLNITTASAFYYPPTESKALNYDLFWTVTWGFFPQWPTCWALMVDWTWTGLPHSHGINVQADWAGPMNNDGSLPPIHSACGWPLVGNAPPPFTVNGL